MKLSDLPAMLVEGVEEDERGTTVRGRFDRVTGVRGDGSFRLTRGEYAWATLEIVDPAEGLAIAKVSYVGVLRMSVKQRYVWLDAYWQLPLVEAIADENAEWQRFTFEASDAQHFRAGQSTGRCKLGSGVPEGAHPTEVEPGGWDHEHCDLCGDRIDAANPIGYRDSEKHFLCLRCYERYAKNQDVSFQVNG